MSVVVNGIDVYDKISRLVASDKAEEMGQQQLADELRKLDRFLYFQNGRLVMSSGVHDHTDILYRKYEQFVFIEFIVPYLET